MKIFKLVVFVLFGLMFVPLKATAVTYEADLLVISQNQAPIFQPSAFSFQTSDFCAMPPHPDLKEKLKQEGKWERFMREFPKKPAGLDSPAPVKAPVTGVRKAIVLLVDFSDKVATTAQSHYSNMLFSSGTYPTGSMRDYYKEVSYNQLDIPGSVSGWYRAPNLYSYYTNGEYGLESRSYPRNAQRLTEHAVTAANPYVDFKNYDNDGDSDVDALFIVHAGRGAEVTGNKNDIWSHQWNTSYPMYVDGVKVFDYSMEPEDGKIGVFAHELGHIFGLPDLYNTTPERNPDSEGVGYWCLMSSGAWGGDGTRPVHLCAWAKLKLGWLTPTVPTTNQNNVLFPNVETNKSIYKLWTDGAPANEYFLVENRQQVGFDGSLPGAGLMIWHIDDNKPTNDEQWYPGLNPVYHYKVAVEPADGLWELEHNIDSGDAGDPFPGSSYNTAFTGLTTPDSDAYLSGPTHVEVTNISPSSATMTANIRVRPFGMGTFSLKSPTNTTTIATLTVNFEWGTTTSADASTVTYTLCYGTDSTFTTYATKNLTGNTYSTTLADNSTYYWKVQAMNEWGGGRWSNQTDWRFYVNLFNEPPGTPILNWPPDGKTIADLTPTFRWTGVSDPDPNDTITYKLWYSKNANFSPKTEVDRTTTNYTPSSPLDNNSTYYWVVFAIDNHGSQTICNGTATFRTGEIIVYPNPANNQVTFAHLPYNSLVKIFTIVGELITTIPGDNATGEAKWQPKGIASGIYLYVIESEGEVITGKLGILR